jgi:hypothetical integral membrane protein (TIGR02206 family)
MSNYFTYDYAGPPFEIFSSGHLVALVIIGAMLAFLIWGWKNPSETAKLRTRWLIIGAMLVIKLSWHAWNVAHGSWSVQEHLPLHICSIGGWALIYILLTRDHRVYEIMFFLGIAAAGQALFQPEAGIYGLPHFRAVQTLAGHGLIVIGLVYVTMIEGMRPTWGSIWRTMVAANVYLFVITVINYLLGSNYMYTLSKPSSASILDLMGPWPWYVFFAEFLALGMFLLLYLPFALADRRTRREIA